MESRTGEKKERSQQLIKRILFMLLLAVFSTWSYSGSLIQKPKYEAVSYMGQGFAGGSVANNVIGSYENPAGIGNFKPQMDFFMDGVYFNDRGGFSVGIADSYISQVSGSVVYKFIGGTRAPSHDIGLNVAYRPLKELSVGVASDIYIGNYFNDSDRSKVFFSLSPGLMFNHKGISIGLYGRDVISILTSSSYSMLPPTFGTGAGYKLFFYSSSSRF